MSKNVGFFCHFFTAPVHQISCCYGYHIFDKCRSELIKLHISIHNYHMYECAKLYEKNPNNKDFINKFRELLKRPSYDTSRYSETISTL